MVPHEKEPRICFDKGRGEKRVDNYVPIKIQPKTTENCRQTEAKNLKLELKISTHTSLDHKCPELFIKV